MQEMWPCPQCHSLNVAKSSRCYSCHRPREADQAELPAAGRKAASPETATPAPVAAGSIRPPAEDVLASAGKAIRRLTAGGAAAWAGMSGFQKSATMAAVLIVGGVAGGAFRGDFWAQLAFLVGMVLLVPTILLRSREGPRMAGPGPRWGLCPFSDSEGRFCRLSVGHKGPHEASPGDGGLASGPATLIRTYAARSNQEAVMAFQADAAILAQHGYEPTSQSWAEDQRGPSAGSVVMWGAFAASKRRGGGTLTVTYRRVQQVQPVQQAQVAPPPPAAPTIPDQIRALGELRDQGLLTSDEFEEKKRELLSRM